jgi:hypothetical protein
MKHEAAKLPQHRRERSQEPERDVGPTILSRVEPPKMRVVSKGWSYRESLRTQEQVEAQIPE